MPRHIDTLFISHGGGPLPLLGDPEHHELVEQLTALGKSLNPPSAILVLSAHWEAPVATITAGANPSLIYDYYGFPAESYAIEYPCPGAPNLARQVHDALKKAGLPTSLDEERGFDHGLFVPLKLMFPQADIPCIQLSLMNPLDAGTHIEIGRALQTLDVDRLLVIGSGFSFHNMREFFNHSDPESNIRNEAFEKWLEDTVCNPDLTEADRTKRLIYWDQAPSARFCHPREEHLVPLFVCYGLNERPGTQHLSARILGKKTGTFIWSGSKGMLNLNAHTSRCRMPE
ncbi:class III extradiol ring-cleavage dioxygenase [Marinobacter sp. chi1]|uniref:Class III extradiol ring-cleavage dioxygenase n=1 Tax=Marinobacter suaedae TaxID=3057675 RepID=A0ABT8W1T3_9GAMM|nr:class III extradiol ring-cleavage dioxygenase [Marinobacter sp. chi1]MDO3722141.1 class III extradiol ring-cleavage dioxygenase [Marinobacter sp. chi1]